MKYLLRNKIFLLFLLVLIYFSPTAISLPQQSRSENIITAMGVDKTDEGYEVHIQYVLPYLDSNSSLKVMTGKGSSVSEAVENVDMEYGKISGFAHCRAVIINDEACMEGLTQIMDYVVRIKTNTNNVTLINSRGSSKDVLECATNLDNELYTIINSNGIAAEQRKYQDLKTVNDYYNCLFGNCHSIAINVIDTEDAEEEGGASSSGKSGGENSTQSGPKKSKTIKNNGELAIIKEGKKVLELTDKESDNLAWFDKDVREGKINLEHFTDDLYTDASLNFFVISKKNKISVNFHDGEPYFNLKIKALVRSAQVSQENMREEIYQVARKKFSPTLISALKDKISSQLKDAETHFKANKYDVINCAEYFHKFCPREYAEYISHLPSEDDFITHVHFSYTIDIEQRR